MVKFVVVVYRLPEWTADAFRAYFRETHGLLAIRLPGLQKYVQNFPVMDDVRRPQWDAVIELYFATRDEMERAWTSDEGRAATADLEVFADLTRTSWAIVDAIDFPPDYGRRPYTAR